MNTPTTSPVNHSHHALLAFGLTALLAVGAATAQVIAGPDGQSGVVTGIDATGSAQSERNACLSGATPQDKTTCLRESASAAADKRAGTLNNHGREFQANAVERCKPLSGDAQTACVARVLGYGSASGSVTGGGVLRETETVAIPAGQPAVIFEAQTNGPILVLPGR